MSKKLTPKQARFCQEYLIDLNASAAALRAGYSKKTAPAIGWENLQKPEIQAKLTESRKELMLRVNCEAEQVILELMKTAFSDIRDLYCPTTGRLLDPNELNDDTAPWVSSVKHRIRESPQGTVRDTEIKTYDKIKALELLGRHLGIFNDKLEVKTNEPQVVIVRPEKYPVEAKQNKKRKKK